MSTITASHHEDPIEIHCYCSTRVHAIGVYVDAEITYQPGQMALALEGVDRLAESLRRQIADAADTYPQETR